MNYNSETERPYAIDVVCPIGRGLRVTLKNYTKQECDAVMNNFKIHRDKMQLLILIEMAEHEYAIYPANQTGNFEHREWFGQN